MFHIYVYVITCYIGYMLLSEKKYKKKSNVNRVNQTTLLYVSHIIIHTKAKFDLLVTHLGTYNNTCEVSNNTL